MPRGVITYQRILVDKLPHLEGSDVDLSPPDIENPASSVPEGRLGVLKLVATNIVFGQNVLGSDCCAEAEIPFYLYPELIASILFCESLKENEALVVSGCKKFNHHLLVGNRFEWAGDYQDVIPRDAYRKKLNQLVIVSGLRASQGFHAQFMPDVVLRDFRSAYVGSYRDPLSSSSPLPICLSLPAFPRPQRSKYLEFVILLLACSHSRRGLCYCAKNGVRFQQEVRSLIQYIEYHKVTSGKAS